MAILCQAKSIYDFKMQYYFQALMLSLMEEDRNSIQLIWDHY